MTSWNEKIYIQKEATTNQNITLILISKVCYQVRYQLLYVLQYVYYIFSQPFIFHNHYYNRCKVSTNEKIQRGSPVKQHDFNQHDLKIVLSSTIPQFSTIFGIRKKHLGTFIVHLLNCINFMKIDEKSIVKLQKS